MRLLLILTLSTFGAWTKPSVAQGNQTLDCTFKTECADTDGCAESGFDLTLSYMLKPLGPNGMISRAEKTDVNGTTRGLVAVRNQVTRYQSGEFHEGAEETLTINAEGDARFVVTLPEVPMIITYAGTCEVIE